MIKREDALLLLKKHLKNKNLIKHSLAVEAGVKGLADKFDEDREKWGLVGLLHDIDYSFTADTPEEHGLKAMDILEEEKAGLDEDMMYAIKAHSGYYPRKSRLDEVLYAVDPLTGLIVASALMHPEKKIDALDVDFLMRRFKEKSFAKGARREVIASCEAFMPLDEFMENVLISMKGIHEELGL